MYPRWKEVVHGAVEPSNILCRQKYKPGGALPSLVLGDFSDAFVGQAKKDANLGTRFPAPEFLIVSASSDVWGLGVTIHILLHGKGPLIFIPEEEAFDITALDEVEQRKQRRIWAEESNRRLIASPNPDYSKELDDCMQQCLQLDSARRIDSKRLIRVLEEQRARCLHKQAEREHGAPSKKKEAQKTREPEHRDRENHKREEQKQKAHTKKVQESGMQRKQTKRDSGEKNHQVDHRQLKDESSKSKSVETKGLTHAGDKKSRLALVWYSEWESMR